MLKADLSCVPDLSVCPSNPKKEIRAELPHSESELHIISSLETPGYQDISEYQQPWPHSNSVKQFISLTEKLKSFKSNHFCKYRPFTLNLDSILPYLKISEACTC